MAYNNVYEYEVKPSEQEVQLQQQLDAANKQYQDLINQQRVGTLGQNDQGFTTVGGGMNTTLDLLRPDYMSMLTQEGGLDPRFQQTLGTSFSALRDKAMAEGDTEATALMRQQLGNQITGQRGQMARDMAGSVANARSGLAMRGGLRGGAAERLGQAGVRQSMLGNQALGRQGIDQNLNLSLQNENLKNQMLGQLGGVEQNIQSGNIQTMANDVANQNTFFQNLYTEDAKAEAASRTADAQKKASSGK